MLPKRRIIPNFLPSTQRKILGFFLKSGNPSLEQIQFDNTVGAAKNAEMRILLLILDILELTQTHAGQDYNSRKNTFTFMHTRAHETVPCRRRQAGAAGRWPAEQQDYVCYSEFACRPINITGVELFRTRRPERSQTRNESTNGTRGTRSYLAYNFKGIKYSYNCSEPIRESKGSS